MIYSLTDKLNFNDNPKIKIKNKTIEVKADAATVLSVLDIIQNYSEIEAAIQAGPLLFNKKDNDTLLKENFNDYITIVSTAVSLALGQDPDEEGNTQGEE